MATYRLSPPKTSHFGYVADPICLHNACWVGFLDVVLHDNWAMSRVLDDVWYDLGATKPWGRINTHPHRAKFPTWRMSYRGSLSLK